MSDATTALAEALDEDCPTLQRWQIEQVAEVVVAAVRGLSPDLQAELIGGEATTEWAIKWDQNDVDFPFLSRSAAASVAVREHLDDEDTYRIESRSVIRGPWTPEPSEETP